MFLTIYNIYAPVESLEGHRPLNPAAHTLAVEVIYIHD